MKKKRHERNHVEEHVQLDWVELSEKLNARDGSAGMADKVKPERDRNEPEPGAIVNETISQIVSEAQRVDPRILNRIVPQVYNEDMFWTVMQVYEFKSIIFTLYATEWTPESVYDFCFRSGCRYVTLWDYLLTPEMLALWDTQGINVAVHTVNDQEAADAFFDMGVDMIYTDSLPA